MITDNVWEFSLAGKIKFGNGAVEEAGWEARRLGGSRVLVVTDKGVGKAGLVEKVKSSLEKENLEIGLFDSVQPDPAIQVYHECLEFARQEKYDAVVGLGGGSSMDVAKVVAALLVHGGGPLDYVAKPTGKGKPIRKGVPVIAIPTTSGTGSEVSPVAVITLPEKGLKVGISNNQIRPDVALVDPLMTVTVPPSITGSTGMDALAHAVEAYTTRRFDCRPKPATPEQRPVYTGANILTDAIASTSIRLVVAYLRRAVNNGCDLEARKGMSLASLSAGIAFTNAGLTAVHAMSMAIGAKYHMAHGVTNALLLPYVMEYNAPSSFERFAHVAQLMGENVEGLSARDAAMKSVSAVKALIEDINLPRHLSSFGAKPEDVPDLAKSSMKIQRLLVCNPRRITSNDLEAIFRKAL
jgi:alcohol dehydrogenase class IV